MDRQSGSNGKTVSTVQIKISVLLVLVLAHVVLTLFFIVPGYLLIDEVIYHWASKSLEQIGGFEIWNGYTEFPSQELQHMFAAPYKGRLVSQYPYLFNILTYFDPQASDSAGARRHELILHLHRLQDHQHIPFLDLISFSYWNRNDLPGHGRLEVKFRPLPNPAPCC